jgi:hypothetical protein
MFFANIYLRLRERLQALEGVHVQVFSNETPFGRFYGESLNTKYVVRSFLTTAFSQ